MIGGFCTVKANYTLLAPVLDNFNVDLTMRMTNGSLFNAGNDSIFRQPPSPEVDEAWHRISKSHTFLVDREDIIGAGKDPEISVRTPAFWNMGEKYFVQLDGPHQLHCLDAIRRQAYADYYFGPHGSDHPLHWAHIAHCLDIVRQSLMCSSSTDILTFTWVETQKKPWYDFNANHKCRDHMAIMQWSKEQSDLLDYGNERNLTKPKDIDLQPMEAEYYMHAPALREWLATHDTANTHSHGH